MQQVPLFTRIYPFRCWKAPGNIDAVHTHISDRGIMNEGSLTYHQSALAIRNGPSTCSKWHEIKEISLDWRKKNCSDPINTPLETPGVVIYGSCAVAEHKHSGLCEISICRLRNIFCYHIWISCSMALSSQLWLWHERREPTSSRISRRRNLCNEQIMIIKPIDSNSTHTAKRFE